MDAKTQFAHFHLACRMTYLALSTLWCFSKTCLGVQVWAFIKMLLS